MKLVMYNNFQLGLYQDDQVYNLSESLTEINAPTPQDMINAVGCYLLHPSQCASGRRVDGVILDSVSCARRQYDPIRPVSSIAYYLDMIALADDAFVSAIDITVPHNPVRRPEPDQYSMGSSR